MSEQDLQRQISDWVRRQYPWAFIRKVPITPMLVGNGRAVPNPMKGVPDLLVIIGGKTLWLECKQKGKENRKDQEEQRETQAEMTAAGAFVAVALSLDSAIEAIRFGLRR